MILPWKIIPVGASGRVVNQFTRRPSARSLGCTRGRKTGVAWWVSWMVQGTAGCHRWSVPLDMAVQSFGGFLQYHVCSCTEPQEPQHSGIDAFQFMMSSCRQQTLGRPWKKPKDTLFNAIVDLLEEQRLSYSPAEPESSRQNLVSSSADWLLVTHWWASWHSQEPVLPSPFHLCPIYWIQYAQKLKAPEACNLSSDIWKAVSRSLFSLLHWKHKRQRSGVPCWQSSSVCWLHWKVEKLRHALDTPVRKLSDLVTLMHVKATISLSLHCSYELNCGLEWVQTYENIFLNEFCPGDPYRWYVFIQRFQRTCVKSSIVFCTHSRTEGV